jgi:transcriptional regulator with XRE-family HTH domain
MTLGTYIRQRRKELGLSQEALGERIGKDQTYVSQVERGAITMPSIEMLEAFARVLRVRRVDLLQAAGWAENADAPPMAEAEPVDVAGLIERTIADIEAEDVSEVTKDLLRLALRNERERIQREARERHDSEALDPR